MSREEIQKLLGGYATGTLTSAECEALFAAALEDQELFEALAREEPLRELLRDPIAKTRLLAAVQQKPQPGYWRWLRPAAWAIPAVGLAAIVVVLIVQRQETRPVMIAQAPALPRMGPVEPVPSALPQNLEKRKLPLMARAIKAVPVDSLAGNTAPAAPSAKDAAGPVPARAAAVPPPPPAPAAPALPQVVPAPINPPGAAQESVVVTPQQQLGQQGQQSSAAVRLEAAPGQTGVGGYIQLTDARALFFGQPNVPLVPTNLVDAEQLGRRKTLAAPAPAARNAREAAVRQIGLRYSVQRRLASGQTAAVIPNEVLDAGDQVTLNVEPNQAGYLTVFERAAAGWRELSSSRVERLTSYSVPARGALAFGPSGTIDLFVVFSREAQATPNPVPEARLAQVTSVNLPERLTYVVSTANPAPGQTVAFPITLTHK